MNKRLDIYCKILPEFALYFSFAKHEKVMFQLFRDYAFDDLLQIIAEGILCYEDSKEINNFIKREMYFFCSRFFGYKKPNTPKELVKKYYYKSKIVNKCDLCLKESSHYHYKSFIPNKLVCRLCYNKLKRQDKKRNKLNN